MSRRTNQKKHGLPRDSQETELRSWCDDHGVELRITNERQHWQFRRGLSIVNWWPSTARLRDACDKDYFRVLLGDIGGFLASNFPPLEEPPFGAESEQDAGPPGDMPTYEQRLWDQFATAALAGCCVRDAQWTRLTETVGNVADAMMAERARRKAGQ